MAIPLGHLRLGPRLTDTVYGGQQQGVCWGRAGTWRGPKRLEPIPNPGLLRHRPESRWQTKLAQGSRHGNGGGAIADHCGQLLGGAQIGLVDDAGFTAPFNYAEKSNLYWVIHKMGATLAETNSEARS